MATRSNKSRGPRPSQSGAASKSKQKKNRKGKLAINVDSSLFSGSLLYEKRGAPAALGTRMKFTDQTRKSVSGGELIIGTSALGPVPPNATVESFEINAGLMDLFPQLAPIANTYSEYTFRKLHFRYVPSVGSITQGRLTFVFNRNVQSSPPSSFTAAASYAGTTAVNVWEDMVFMAEVSEKKYVRNAPYPPNADPKTFDAGRFTFLLENVVPVDPQFDMGMILIDYEVFLSNRVLAPPIGAEVLLPRFITNPGGATMTAANGFFADYFQQPVLNPMMTVQMGADGAYLGIPPGMWFLTFTGEAVNNTDPGTSLNWQFESNGGSSGPSATYVEQVGSPLTVGGGYIDTETFFTCNVLIYVPEMPIGDLSQSEYSVFFHWSNDFVADWVPGSTVTLQHVLTRLPPSAVGLFETPPFDVESAGPIHRRIRHAKATKLTKKLFIPTLPASSSFNKKGTEQIVRNDVKLEPENCSKGCLCRYDGDGGS